MRRKRFDHEIWRKESVSWKNRKINDISNWYDKRFAEEVVLLVLVVLVVVVVVVIEKDGDCDDYHDVDGENNLRIKSRRETIKGSM